MIIMCLAPQCLLVTQDFADAMAAACPPGGQPVLLVCEFGVVSVVAATRLAEQGYTGVSAVRGGFEAWRLEAQGSIEGAIDEEMPFPEWSGETDGLAMWPVPQADPPVEEEREAAADQGIGFGLDDLDLGDLPPPSPPVLFALAHHHAPELGPPLPSPPLPSLTPRTARSSPRMPSIHPASLPHMRTVSTPPRACVDTQAS